MKAPLRFTFDRPPLVLALALGTLAATVAGGAAAGGAGAAAFGLPGVAVLAVCEGLRPRRQHLGMLRRFALGLGLAASAAHLGLWLGVAGAIALEPGLIAGLLLVATGLTAGAGWVLASGVRADLMGIRTALTAVADGDASAGTGAGDGDEIAQLARAAERLSHRMTEREAERDAAQAMRHDLAKAMVEQLTEREAERDAAEGRRRELVVAVAHDVRTPLASLQLLASAVHDGLVDAETQVEYSRQMLVHLLFLRRLTDELFELSRLEAGDVSWPMQAIDVREVVLETVETLRPLGDEREVAIRVEVPPGLAPARAAYGKVLRVLVNVLHNALEHTHAGGHVGVFARNEGTEIEIRVGDTGPGFAATDRERAFEPFFRGRTGASGTRPGAGLGLAISRAIVEAHGGRIWIEDAEGGACVAFSLRRADAVHG